MPCGFNGAMCQLSSRQEKATKMPRPTGFLLLFGQFGLDLGPRARFRAAEWPLRSEEVWLPLRVCRHRSSLRQPQLVARRCIPLRETI